MGPRDVLLEAKLSWGDDVLSVAHVPPRDRMRVADLGLSLLTESDAILARVIGGRVVLLLPSLRFGRCRLQLTLVPREDLDRVPAPLDRSVARSIALAFALHVVFLTLAFVGRESSADSEQRAIDEMRSYATSADARARGTVVGPREQPKSDEAPGAAKAEEGLAGNPARVDERGRRARTRGEQRLKTLPGEEKTFGMIAIVTGHNAGSSSFAEDIGRGAMGNIFAPTIDEALGSGGLGLSGHGEGGGGLGAAVPLAGVGVGQGFGSCNCGVGGTHKTRAPIVRDGIAVTNDRLPAETIRRVVRQNFGRLRACYQRGLDRDPSLEGRISVKFVIDRTGTVIAARAAEQTLDNDDVTSCVVGVYRNLSFPEPAGGIVTVTYPVVFEKT